MRQLHVYVKRVLREGSKRECAKTAVTCFEIRKLEKALWAFARGRGIEPTNNVVEPALRHAERWPRFGGGSIDPVTLAGPADRCGDPSARRPRPVHEMFYSR